MAGTPLLAAYPLPSLPNADRPAAVFEEARRSGGTIITVSGLAGAGKSTWTRQFAASATRQRVVSVGADGFEKDFAFALVDKVAHAAGVRLGILGESGLPDPLSVARVLLHALAHDTSPARRLVVIIDNAQWIDDPSLAVLRFVLSRMAHAGVCLVLSGHEPRTVAAAREIEAADPSAWNSLRAVSLSPLNEINVREYLSKVHDIEVSLRLARLIRERSGGLPVLVDALALSMERPARPRRTHWDEDVTFASQPENPFGHVDTGQPTPIIATIEIAAVLRDAIARSELRAIASALHYEIDIEGALATGLLRSEGVGMVVPFHDLYSTDVRSRLPDARRRAVLTSAAALLDNPHRAFICRLDAAEEIDATLLSKLHAMVTDAVNSGQAARGVGYLRQAVTVATGVQHDDLIVEACLLAAANLISPSVIDFIPDLERAPHGPVRDLALLQTRQITGDTEWAAAFAADLLARPIDHPDALLLRTQISMMAVMIQLTTNDYEPIGELLNRTRSFATELGAAPRSVWDERLLPLLVPEEVSLRCIGLTIVAAARLGDVERVNTEIGALSIAIASANDSAALIDALTCRAGVLAGAGVIHAAAADLERALTIAASGIVGWSLGHARVLLAYCYWVLGRPAESTTLLETATLVALDNIDVSSRPLVYLLRAVLAAASGDENTHAQNVRIAREVTVTEYETFGAELELLAAVEQARAAERPGDIIDILSDERLSNRWLAGSSIFTYRVDALASLGLPEAADRELSRLKSLTPSAWTPIYGSLDWLEGRVAEAYGLTEQAIRFYRSAVTSTTLPSPRAQAEHDAGRLLVVAGNRVAGTRLLRSAVAGFRRLGAAPALRRALATLASSDGTLSSSTQFTGLESLSSREREVALLAGSGLTNGEIARRLYLSVPTVSFHMRNVLAKLELQSRRGLRAVLHSSA